MLKVLHFLLIASILTCPMFCRSELCACAEESCAVETGECDECPSGYHCQDSRDEYPDHEPQDHDPGDHGPCESCQCICGGAIIVENIADIVKQDGEDTLHQIVSANRQWIPGSHFRKHCRATSPHGVSITSGRTLCVLHESFLL